MTPKTTVEKFKAAYNYGFNDKKNDSYANSAWFLKAFEVAYNYGHDGMEINWNDIVTCIRYGNIPDSGVSYNYLSEKFEKGLSVANALGEAEVASTVWFSDRRKVEVQGIRLPCKGSDGETLVLPLGVEDFDF